MEISDAQKPVAELIVHSAKIVEGELSVGSSYPLNINQTRRNDIRKNHSATHLLHLALKEILGEHVQQKGSLVAADRLRFDYSHFDPLSSKEIVQLEHRVNEMVQANADTETKVSSIKDAQAEGATMLFGEKYGDKVRMVRIGVDSLELCGGTHVSRAGDIGLFKIITEGSLASGVRRLEAVTGMHALAYVQSQEARLKEASQALKVPPEQIAERLEKMQKRTKTLERDLEKARTQAAMAGSGSQSGAPEPELFGEIKVQFMRADGTPKKSLRPLADQLRDKLGTGIVVLTSCEDEKMALLVAATKDLKGKVHAGNLVKAATSAIGGSGGGRPDFAQGGGDAGKHDEALKALRAALSA